MKSKSNFSKNDTTSQAEELVRVISNRKFDVNELSGQEDTKTM